MVLVQSILHSQSVKSIELIWGKTWVSSAERINDLRYISLSLSLSLSLSPPPPLRHPPPPLSQRARMCVSVVVRVCACVRACARARVCLNECESTCARVLTCACARAHVPALNSHVTPTVLCTGLYTSRRHPPKWR